MMVIIHRGQLICLKLFLLAVCFPISQSQCNFEGVLDSPSIPGCILCHAPLEMLFRIFHDAIFIDIKISVAFLYTLDIGLPDFSCLSPIQGWIVRYPSDSGFDGFVQCPYSICCEE